MEAIIEARGLGKRFGSGEGAVEVLRGIDLSVTRGEFVSVMGASGCGKSTLLYLLGGLDRPSAGEVRVMGEDLSRLGDARLSRLRRGEVGFVFQFYNLVQNLTVEENVTLPLRMMCRQERAGRGGDIAEVIETVGIGDILRRYPNQLSGGQQQRVAVARAIATGPSIVLADEPTGNLDSGNGAAVMGLFRRINRERGITIVQVTHDEEKASYGTRIVRLSDGEIVGDAPTGA